MNKNKIVIVVEGGVVQAVLESGPCAVVEVILIDHDNLRESCSREERERIADKYTDGMVDREIVDVLDLEAEHFGCAFRGAHPDQICCPMCLSDSPFHEGRAQ